MVYSRYYSLNLWPLQGTASSSSNGFWPAWGPSEYQGRKVAAAWHGGNDQLLCITGMATRVRQEANGEQRRAVPLTLLSGTDDEEHARLLVRSDVVVAVDLLRGNDFVPPEGGVPCVDRVGRLGGSATARIYS